MQYFSLQHQTLLPSPVTSTAGCCFCFGSISSVFLELVLHQSTVTYWAPTDLRSSSFSVLFASSYFSWGSKGRNTEVVCHSLLQLFPSPFLPVICWRPSYGGPLKIMATSSERSHRHCYTQCPQACSRLLPTHTSARDSWTLMGESGSVSCGVTPPFFWVLVRTSLCLCPPRVYFPTLYKFWQLYGGVNGDLLQEGLCLGLLHPEPLSLQQATAEL